jgi:two-component system cell cycle sensor histidine kinase PleC
MTSEAAPTAALEARELTQSDSLAVLAAQTSVLELVAAGASLPRVLDTIVRGLESLFPGARASILLLDIARRTLHHGAAPSLPPAYAAAIDGMIMGPRAGSCGAAAYLGRPVEVADIATDARWEDYRALALPHELRACWSTPIRGHGVVMGTFAVYYSTPRLPSARERRLVAHFTHLTSVAIDHETNRSAREAAERERRARREAEVAREVAEAASHAKTDFLTAMSHELRTPLQAISGFAELLGTMTLSPQRHQAALRHVEEATAHILALVDDVLDVAKIEAGVLTLDLADVPADEVVAEVAELLAPVADTHDVTLRVDDVGARTGGETCLLAKADRRRLRQILINLVTNGVRYNRADGWVRIGCAADATGDRVTIEVRDSGAGIAPELLDRLFVPFDRLGADATGEPGVGIGLVLTRALVEAMGGRLRVTSEVGAGTCVSVELPAGQGTQPR